MAPTKARSRPSQRQPRTAPSKINKWTSVQREFLVVIHSDEFAFTIKQIADVFNYVFVNDLITCGITDGLKPNVVDAQYRESKKERSSSCAWASICRVPTTAAQHRRWQDVKHRIETAAAALSLRQSESRFTRPAARHNTSTRSVTTRVHKTKVTKISTTEAPEDTSNWSLRKRTSTKERKAWIQSNLDPRAQIFESRIPSTSEAITTCRNRIQDSDDEEYRPSSERNRRRVIAVNPFVETPEDISNMRYVLPSPPYTPSTPRRVRPRGQSSPGRLARATVTLDRLYGGPLKLTKEEYRTAQKLLNAVSPQEAHPSQPRLLYRWWHPGSHGFNSTEGFRAAINTFSDISSVSPLPCEALDWDLLFLHLNRMPLTGPFISVSSHFAWVLRLALKEAADGTPDGKITFIDRDMLDPKALYYVPPYQRELRKKFVFTEGAQRYYGSFEFLAWKRIPQSAILHTIDVAELIELSNRLGVLQLHILAGPGDFQTTLQTNLRASRTGISTPVLKALATLARFTGLNNATAEQTAHFLSDVCQGCGFIIEPMDSTEWAKASSIFASAFCDKQASMQELQQAKIAFLDGVRWGLGEFNAKLKDQTVRRKMQKKATAVGLECPAKILSNELDAMKLHLWSYEKKQQRLISATGHSATRMPVIGLKDKDVDIADAQSEESDEDMYEVEQWTT